MTHYFFLLIASLFFKSELVFWFLKRKINEDLNISFFFLLLFFSFFLFFFGLGWNVSFKESHLNFRVFILIFFFFGWSTTIFSRSEMKSFKNFLQHEKPFWKTKTQKDKIAFHTFLVFFTFSFFFTWSVTQKVFCNFF